MRRYKLESIEALVCSWQQGKRLVGSNINAGSVFKWVHPYQLYNYIENKRKYVLVESHKTGNRKTYPAYTLEELLPLLPEEYILGRLRDHWYCISEYNDFEPKIYERTAIDACFNALVMSGLTEHTHKVVNHEGVEK